MVGRARRGVQQPATSFPRGDPNDIAPSHSRVPIQRGPRRCGALSLSTGESSIGATDRDLLGPGGFPYRNPHREHTLVVTRLDGIGVESITQEEAPGEGSGGTLLQEYLVALGRLPVPSGGYRERVLLYRHVDRVRIETRHVEVEHEGVVHAVAVGGHEGSTFESSGHPIELGERIESQQHLL